MCNLSVHTLVKMDHTLTVTDLSCLSSSSESSFECDSMNKQNDTCKLCGKVMRSKFCFCSLKKELQCVLCKELFSELANFRNHVKDHMKPNSCKDKSINKVTASPMDIHNASNTLIKIETVEKKPSIPVKKSQTCVKCGETFETKLSLMAHSLCHTEKAIDTRIYSCLLYTSRCV